jgi:hypothetical protein
MVGWLDDVGDKFKVPKRIQEEDGKPAADVSKLIAKARQKKN